MQRVAVCCCSAVQCIALCIEWLARLKRCMCWVCVCMCVRICVCVCVCVRVLKFSTAEQVCVLGVCVFLCEQ